MVVNLDGYVKAWTKGAERLYGWSTAEVLGQHIRMFYADPDALGTRTSLTELVIDLGSYEFEAKLKRKSGEMFDGLALLTLLRHANGEPKGIIGSTRDITERMQRERGLQQGKDDLEHLVDIRTRELRLTLETLVEGVITIDELGRVEAVNGAAEKLFGYSADEMIGQNVRMLMPPEDSKNHDRHLADYQKTGIASIIGIGRELEARRKDGTIFCIWLSIGKMEVDGVRKFVGSIYDITDRKLLEQATEESRARMADLRQHLEDSIESIRDGFLLFDKDDRLVLCNGALRKEFHVIADYMTPGTLFEEFIRAVYSAPGLIAPEFQNDDVIQQRLELHRNPGVAVVAPVQMQSGRWVVSHEFETRDGGRVVVRSDVTAQVEVEQQIIQAKDAAEKASQAKSDFLSSMSHELRTPMNAILGYAQLLEQTVSSEQADYVDEMLRSGHHMIELINGVLDLAEIEEGSMSFNLEDHEPGPLIDACISMIGASASERGIAVRNIKPPTDMPMVKIDPLRFKQALLNLLSNAIKYNHPDGDVVLECGSSENGIFHIAVIDNGPGIPEGMRHKVFEPFERLGAETSNVPGTGIGLTVTKQLIEGMAGTVGFESTLGEGTKFWINLPVTPA